MKELILFKITMEESGLVSNTHKAILKRLTNEEVERVKALSNEIAQIFRNELNKVTEEKRVI